MALESPSAAAMSLERMPCAAARATSARVPSSRSRDASSAGEPGAVLLAGGVDERDELVHLEERSRGLGRLDAHAAPARRVALDVLVLDGLVENAAERLDELLDRRQPERSDSPPAPVAQLGARGDGTPQLLGLAQLGLLEAQADAAVDLVQSVVAEEGQQVNGQPPAVVGLRVGVDRLVADHALGLRRQPPGGVLVEGGHALGVGRRRGPCGA